MTLDEAIKHCEEVMMENLEKTKDRNASDPIAISCGECASEHHQLAEWLKELKDYREQSGDVISRQAVLEGLRTCYDTETKEYSDGSQWINYEDAVAEMENLPPVTPQPKIGRWIDSHIPESMLCECSECGFTCGAYSFNYCPNCGARMESEDK